MAMTPTISVIKSYADLFGDSDPVESSYKRSMASAKAKYLNAGVFTFSNSPRRRVKPTKPKSVIFRNSPSSKMCLDEIQLQSKGTGFTAYVNHSLTHLPPFQQPQEYLTTPLPEESKVNPTAPIRRKISTKISLTRLA